MSRGKKNNKQDMHAWLMLDKPVGLSSAAAISRVKRIFRPKKIGHAGTLDPLASGLLPIAIGKATKTVPYAMDMNKIYDFDIRFGIETDTDDREGEIVATGGPTPPKDVIERALSAFVGDISQTPPMYSAIKVGGKRAYDLARAGKAPTLRARRVRVHALSLEGLGDRDTGRFRLHCGKGTYVRALARDLGRALGCHGHVSRLRRRALGPFDAGSMITLEALEGLHAHANRDMDASDRPLRPDDVEDFPLLPIDAVLAGLARVRVDGVGVQQLLHGRPALPVGFCADGPGSADREGTFQSEGAVVAFDGAERALAIGVMDDGRFVPRRLLTEIA